MSDLPEKTALADGRKAVPLHFESEQALFVVLHDGPEEAGRGRNFPDLKPVTTVAGPWQVTFDSRWVKPLPASWAPDAKDISLTLSRLGCWSQRPEEGIKGYSGMCYRTTFDLPAPAADRQMFVDVGVVKEMAAGLAQRAGLGLVRPPWRVRVPRGSLKERGNELVITVADTWHNRLCADQALPEIDRLTRVGHNLHEHAARQGLQPAGLLGPVRLMGGRTAMTLIQHRPEPRRAARRRLPVGRVCNPAWTVSKTVPRVSYFPPARPTGVESGADCSLGTVHHHLADTICYHDR